MKKTFITITFLLSVTTAVLAARINPVVLRSFNKEFSNAQFVSWEDGVNYHKATFAYDGKTSYAFYNNEGEKIKVSRHISSHNLSDKLNRQLKRKYAGFWITDLFEFSENGTLHYYIALRKADTKILLHANSHGSWKIY